MDDNFAFIAGHTSWGFPYGTKWEEVGINPSLSLDEKKRLYESGEYPSPAFPELTPARLFELKKMLSTLDDVHSRLAAIAAESGNDDLLDAVDHIYAAMDNIGMWIEIGKESHDGTDKVQNEDTVIEIDKDDLPF